MRRLLLLFIVFFQLSFFLSAQVTLDQLVEKNGIYYKKGEIEPALTYLKIAVKNLTEDEPVIIEHLADILMKKGEKAQACELYKRALKCAFHKKDKERLLKKLKECKQVIHAYH